MKEEQQLRKELGKDVYGIDLEFIEALKNMPESKAIAETADSVWAIIRNPEMKKNNVYRVYENSIRFPFRFKIGLTSTPFITPDSLLKLIQYLCGKTFHNTAIAFNPSFQP